MLLSYKASFAIFHVDRQWIYNSIVPQLGSPSEPVHTMDTRGQATHIMIAQTTNEQLYR